MSEWVLYRCRNQERDLFVHVGGPLIVTIQDDECAMATDITKDDDGHPHPLLYERLRKLPKGTFTRKTVEKFLSAQT